MKAQTLPNYQNPTKKKKKTNVKKVIDVMVAVPSIELWQAKFGLSLIGTVTYFIQTAQARNHSHKTQVFNKQGSLLPEMRQTMCELAIKNNFTHLFFVDCDMSFPPETLDALVRHEKPVVALNCAVKKLPSTPTARQKDENGLPKILHTKDDSKALEQVWRIGTGVMLIDLAVLKDIPKPWFMVEWKAKEEKFVGEDWYFCQKLEAAGIPIYVDHVLSREVGHVGNFVYKLEHVLEEPENGT